MNLGEFTLTEVLGFARLILTLFGFLLVIIQLMKLSASLQSNSQSVLYSQSGDVRKLIMQYPELRKFIFENEPIPPEDTEEYIRARTLAELYANYLEHFVIQKKSFRRKDWKTWKKTILDVYNRSPIIKEAVSNEQNWYTEEFLNFVACQPQKNENEATSELGKHT